MAPLTSRSEKRRSLVWFTSLLLLLAPAKSFAQKHSRAAEDSHEHSATVHVEHDTTHDTADQGEEVSAKGHAAKEEAKPTQEAEKKPAGPRKMHVGITLEKLTKFEVGPGSYQAQYIVHFGCEKGVKCEPEPIIQNGKILSKEKVFEAATDEGTIKSFQIKAEVQADVDLSEYPFDKQVLYAQFHDKDDDVQYEADVKDSSIADDVKLAGWTVGDQFGVAVHKEAIPGGGEDQELIFATEISRPRIAAIFKSFVPVMFMVFVAAFTLLLKPKSAAGRLSTATGGLMSVVMFHLSSTSSLPPLGYLTRLDKFMIATYLVYLVNIFFSVAMVRFEENKKSDLAEKAYLAAAGAVPGVALLAWVLVFTRLV